MLAKQTTLLLLFTILYATFPILHLHGARTLMHIYHISVSINRMLISQLKRNLGVKLMFTPQVDV